MTNWKRAGGAGGGSPGSWCEARTGEGTFSSHKRDATASVPQGSASSDLCWNSGPGGSPGAGARAPPSAAPGPEEVRHGPERRQTTRGRAQVHLCKT